ncbi:glutathione S-transferase [Penicillium frequentans]|uniref:glutathione transferase n=1 Tax=Penicillium frequentans TaxID=3151616 RepID=A0AAD6D3X7_9EURO|nr:glutathione S-transferase [Penicillium glabrum]
MSAAKVYGSIFSTCTQRVLVTLEEAGAAYQLIDVSMQAGQHKDPTYVAEKHPFAKVPTYEDESVKLFESRAICRYLANRYSQKVDLLGSELGLALMEQAASVEYSYFDPPFKGLAYEKIFKRMMGHGEPDAHLVNVYEEQIHQCFDYYESLLAKQTYLAGNTYTIIDVFHLPWFAFVDKLGIGQEVETRPHLLAWWKLVSQRPAWNAVRRKIG